MREGGWVFLEAQRDPYASVLQPEREAECSIALAFRSDDLRVIWKTWFSPIGFWDG
jgi:hypothetical protein